MGRTAYQRESTATARFPSCRLWRHLTYTPTHPPTHPRTPHTQLHTIVAPHTHTRIHAHTSTHSHTHPPTPPHTHTTHTHTHLLTHTHTRIQLWLCWRRLALGMCSRFPHARPRPAPSADAAATNSPAAAGPVRVGPRSASVPATILLRYLTFFDQIKHSLYYIYIYNIIIIERECCLLVLNLVSSTLSCIRQPRPRLPSY